MSRKLIENCKLIVKGLYYLSLILIDRYIFRSNNPFLGIPRTIPELFQPADRVFELLCNQGCISPEASFISCEHLGGSDTEPDKNVVRLDMVYSLPNSGQETIQLFIKLPTAREWSALAKAGLAMTAIDAKEVGFYNDVLPELAKQAGGIERLGFKASQNLFSTWSRAFDRSILIHECIDMDKYHSRPDWMNADTEMVQLIVNSAADLHRRTWQLRNVPSKVKAKYAERGGVDWIAGLSSLGFMMPDSFGKVWRAIRKRTALEPRTISHGDCRLGNCLFTADFSDVILTDWEVTSVTYYMWDISYAMICSFSPDDRRNNEESIIRTYLSAIAENSDNHDVPSLESAMELHKISLLVVNFFGGLISVFGGIGEAQGNSGKDIDSWTEKCQAAMDDALEDEEGLARALSIDVSIVTEFRQDYMSNKPLIRDLMEGRGLLSYLGHRAVNKLKPS